MTSTKIVWKNPQVRTAFNILMMLGFVFLGWSLVFAILFGGSLWWGVIFGFSGLLLVYILGEFAGAYDEHIIEVGDNDSTEAA